MGPLEIIVVIAVLAVVGVAFYYSRKAEKITQARAEEKRLEEEQARAKKKK